MSQYTQPVILCRWLVKTYNSRYHVSIQLNITLAVPIHIQVELDTIVSSLCDLDIGKHDWCGAKLNLGEMQSCQGTREHGLEHRFDNVLDHFAAGSLDVGPQLCNDIIQEA